MRRVAWLLLMLIYLSGCSGFRPAVMPGYVDFPSAENSERPEVAVGRDAKVTTRAGDVHVGEVMRIGEQSLTLGRVGNYGVKETEILFQDILMIEVESGSKVAAIGVRAVGTLAIVFGGLLIFFGLFASFGDLS